MILKNKLLLLTILIPIIFIESSYAAPTDEIFIDGLMNNSAGETIHMKMHIINNATGFSSIFLVGNGGLIHTYNNGSIVHYTLFHVQGNMSSNMVDLVGIVTKSNDSNMRGKPLLIISNTSTGDTTLVFNGYSNYTGIETISIR